MTTAEHRPSTRRRRFKHDDLVAVDLFSGFGGLTRGIEQAGITTIMAANHNRYKVEVHEANHPHAEHWIADLVDPDSSDYHSARDLPSADLLVAGVSCTNHSHANTKKAYAQGLSLFDLDDPDFEGAVTRSERDRATANCVLAYAAQHLPRMIAVECTTELQSWGVAIPGRKKVGDGSTWRWWLEQFKNLGYRYRVLYLNSMFFGVPQSRDRLYIVFWLAHLPAPDLDHKPPSWCESCDDMVEAVWSWRTGVPPTGGVRYGKQYDYRCPRCRRQVIPPMTPSLAALDLSDFGTRIGDRKKPLAASTMARAERCRQRFAEFPAVLMPAKAVHGSEGYPWQPVAPQMSHQETAVLSTVGVLPFRKNTTPTTHAEAMPTVTSDQIPGLLTAAGVIRDNDAIDEATPRAHPASSPLGTEVGSGASQSVLFSGWYKQNGSTGRETAPHPVTDPFGTLTARDTTAVLLAEWRAAVTELPLEDCFFRMMAAHEVGRGCGFDVDFAGHQGTFIVWGSSRDQVDGFGNAVSPQVGEWIGRRLRAALHRETSCESA
jgi:DNA (cytosine-5)-methyltransferase 1